MNTALKLRRKSGYWTWLRLLNGLWTNFIVFNCQVVEWVLIFANPCFQNRFRHTLYFLCHGITKIVVQPFVVYRMKYPIFQLYFLGIPTRLLKGSCVERKSSSNSWDIPWYATRKRCIRLVELRVEQCTSDVHTRCFFVLAKRFPFHLDCHSFWFLYSSFSFLFSYSLYQMVFNRNLEHHSNVGAWIKNIFFRPRRRIRQCKCMRPHPFLT